jgi:hypothetical protein
MQPPHINFQDWVRIRTEFETQRGFLVAGRDPDTACRRRINEPCRHEDCPYALIGFGLLNSPEAARRAYRRRAKSPRDVVETFDLVIYEFTLRDTLIAQPARRHAASFLDELCHGSPEGPAWSQVRYLVEAEPDLTALAFPRRNGRDVLVLRNLVDLVELDAVEDLSRSSPAGI